MRLLNVYNLTFHDFDDATLPPYAIASHRWGDDEATYQDVASGIKSSAGYMKVKGFCEFTRTRNQQQHRGPGAVQRLEWIWIDTCCIDRRSSQEVSENINSMYKYYRNAVECYAYLSDVSLQSQDEFTKSAWFRRGWTLQELIAPPFVIFVSKTWTPFGHKCTQLDKGRSAKAGKDVCRNFHCEWRGRPLNSAIWRLTYFPDATLNEGMSTVGMHPSLVSGWLYLRQTKRVEDLAYCLLGLLGVFMPTMYGEGKNAWLRLEKELTSRGTYSSELSKPKQLEDLESSEWDQIWKNSRPDDDDDGGGGGGGGRGGGGGQGAGGSGCQTGGGNDYYGGNSQGGERSKTSQRNDHPSGGPSRFGGPRSMLSGVGDQSDPSSLNRDTPPSRKSTSPDPAELPLSDRLMRQQPLISPSSSPTAYSTITSALGRTERSPSSRMSSPPPISRKTKEELRRYAESIISTQTRSQMVEGRSQSKATVGASRSSSRRETSTDADEDPKSTSHGDA